MSFNPEDLVGEATKGAMKGALEWSSNKIKELVKKLRNKELAFIQDPENIIRARAQRKSDEWKMYDKYIHDKRLRLLVQLGMTLRCIENDCSNLSSIRSKIFSKFGRDGLHIAEVVQNGILSALIGISIGKVPSSADISSEVENILNEVKNFVNFIQTSDDVNEKVRILLNRIDVLSPPVVIIFGSGTANAVTLQIGKEIEKKIRTNYQAIKLEENSKVMVFFIDKEYFRQDI